MLKCKSGCLLYYFRRQKARKANAVNESVKSPINKFVGTPGNVVPAIATSIMPTSSTSLTSSSHTSVVPDSSNTSDSSSEQEVVTIGWCLWTVFGPFRYFARKLYKALFTSRMLAKLLWAIIECVVSVCNSAFITIAKFAIY